MFLYPQQKLIIIKLFFIAKLVFASLIVQANPDNIRILGPRDKFDPVYDYFFELTKLVLSKTQDLHPNSKLIFIMSDRTTQGRSLLLLDDNSVDLIWVGTNKEREQRYLPIYFPLFRGLLGYRVLLIRKENLNKFSMIKKPEQLKKLTACQGAHWPDSDILEANGYKVSRVVHYYTMFNMLAKNRCDYFPRAIYEGYAEQRDISDEFPNIILLDEPILHYNFPFYYFVDKNNTALAQRLAVGLNMALKDGSFMLLMKSHSVSKHLFPLAQWKSKRFFELLNNDFDIKILEKHLQLWLNLKAKD